jgi:hypothetical protein
MNSGILLAPKSNKMRIAMTKISLIPSPINSGVRILFIIFYFGRTKLNNF